MNNPKKKSHRLRKRLRGLTPRVLELSKKLNDIEFTSKPASLMELVEPAKVDPQYQPDQETCQYLERRQQESPHSPVFHHLRIPQLMPPAGNNDSEQHKMVALTRRIHEDWEEVQVSMKELRQLVAGNGGLPVGDKPRVRGRLWLVMLEVQSIRPDTYFKALGCCPSASAQKIDNDGFRTLADDPDFDNNPQRTEALVRILNALLCAPDRTSGDPAAYVQGMNTLLAPFLYVMEGEHAAFYAYRQFLRRELPLYARPSLPGVHACVQLVDECLSQVDAELFAHLRAHGAVARIYAFPAAMTLSASVGPLREVVRLWDFLLAFGVHLNVVCLVAQVASMRELLLTTEQPMAFLRRWPPLRAESVIGRAQMIYQQLDPPIKQRIKQHTWDIRMAETLASAPPATEMAGGVKRDLPLSPLPAGGERQRSRTFSGMLINGKRIRTGHPVRSVPSYGKIGLGLSPPSSVGRADVTGNQEVRRRLPFG